eukprot:CAMPEP_0180504396 /NCGR_PEP_ID=MMETSP1036_2-20121128/46694_1 /TAXON_ID=632150 /ORGANISM="Azadinium spinosum, Strain 3D9" /LENGTH=88 /DNA_ID=CAMNT_0022513789 /DNA_START=1 /DNA_END=264 /DNA_ORIENTATION=+
MNDDQQQASKKCSQNWRFSNYNNCVADFCEGRPDAMCVKICSDYCPETAPIPMGIPMNDDQQQASKKCSQNWRFSNYNNCVADFCEGR